MKMYVWRKGRVAYLQPSFTQMIYGYIMSVFYITNTYIVIVTAETWL